MTQKQLITLSLCIFLPSAVGNALMALLSLYAQALGADASQLGIWLALAFAVLALTTMGSGWLSRRFGQRKGFMTLAAAGSAPVVLLMAVVDTMAALGLLILVLWGLYGLITTMATLLAGLEADNHRRGRIYGVLGVAGALGQVAGGLVAGLLVERWGFSSLFLVSALTYVALTVIVLNVTEITQVSGETGPSRLGGLNSRHSRSQQVALALLLVASVFAFSGNFVSDLVRPLIMDGRDLSPVAIASTVAIGGLVNLPLPYLTGWLSDRLGRRRLLYACYSLTALGVVLMIPASAAWHFWIAQALVVLVNSTQPIGAALVTDLVEPQALETSLARYTAARWIGAVVSFAGGGLLVQGLGINVTLLVTGMVVLAAIPLVRATASRPLATALVAQGDAAAEMTPEPV